MRTPRYLLVLVLLLGLALLWRTLEWYDGYLRRMSSGPRTPASAGGGPGPAAVPATRRPRPTPTPSPEAVLTELEALRSPDVFKRREAAALLRQRLPTPALEQAVDEALAEADPAEAKNEGLRTDLLCLKSRFPGRISLELVLEALPKEERAYDWNVNEGVQCCLRSLGERAAEDPVRIREALLRAVYGFGGNGRGAAVDALRNVDLPDIPESLRARLRTGDDHERALAFDAALALGALAKDPELVERALLDPYHGVSQTARRVILKSPGDAGARMLARALVRDPGNAEAVSVFRQRDLLERDVTPALLEIALDGTAPEHHRRSALDLIGRYGNPLAADALLGVAHGPDEALRSAGEAAITELERGAKGKILPMKELGPRSTGRPSAMPSP